MRFAQSRCSSAFFRLPGYSVLQSVRKGKPPLFSAQLRYRAGVVGTEEGEVP